MESKIFYLLFITCELVDNAEQYENLASRKTVTVSTRYNDGYFSPSKAVDGDRSTYLLDCALTASGQKEAWLTVDLGEKKNIVSISVLHGGLGFNASSMRSSDSGLFADSNGDGTVYVANPIRTICASRFDEKDAQVVCLAWGFLPDNPIYNISRLSSSIPFYNVLDCVGNEVNINTCPKGSTDCPSGLAVAVKCQRCDLGFYGENCTKCPQNCLNNTCHFQIGECFECIDGYTGQYCETECPAGKYGRGCSVECGQCINNTQCNHENGSCPGECSPGWRGDTCDQTCQYGYFGQNCNTPCYIPNCKNITTCDGVTGECFVGCIEGWAGRTCDKCDQGFYGQQCNMTCSEFCRGKLCDPTTGQCNDCVDGRSEDFCETEVVVPVDNSGASTDGNTWTTAPMIAVSLLSVAVILLIAILFVVFLRKKHQSSRAVKHNPDYELAITTKGNNEYTGIHVAKSPEYTEVETSHYMEIENSEIKNRTEYINLDQL